MCGSVGQHYVTLTQHWQLHARWAVGFTSGVVVMSHHQIGCTIRRVIYVIVRVWSHQRSSSPRIRQRTNQFTVDLASVIEDLNRPMRRILSSTFILFHDNALVVYVLRVLQANCMKPHVYRLFEPRLIKCGQSSAKSQHLRDSRTSTRLLPYFIDHIQIQKVFDPHTSARNPVNMALQINAEPPAPHPDTNPSSAPIRATPPSSTPTSWASLLRYRVLANSRPCCPLLACPLRRLSVCYLEATPPFRNA
jgi:hypothetical protein